MVSRHRIDVGGAPYGVAATVADFGHSVTAKLLTRTGSREDHLRGPFEVLLSELAEQLGVVLIAVGETQLPDLAVRPDYAIDVAGARVGYVELKKPGHGVPGTWLRPTKHDSDQWEKLKLLPNVLYSDGEQFAVYSYGRIQGKVARLEPALSRAGSSLHAVDAEFSRVVSNFLLWKPERPRNLDDLVRLTANLCRLLREDVAVEIDREAKGLTAARTFSALADDWRQVLFPKLSDDAFADQYAQTVTFALLLARVEGVSFEDRSITEIARLLGRKHSLMGRALTVLTDQPEEEHSVALTTLIRVLSVVDWAALPNDSYSTLYENFLEIYDPVLRKKSGVYYTPAPVVSFLTRFVDDILRHRLNRKLGFADSEVIVVDPAMGTGSFLAEVINTAAATMKEREGPGAVGPHLRDLSNRLIGFENQAAPYAISELRVQALLRARHSGGVISKDRRFLADTLDDPDLQTLPIGRMYEAIKISRTGADEVKKSQPVMVVLGNPPYKDKAKGTSNWIETASVGVSSPSLNAFRRPGNGRLEYVLSNLYVYFWRWATWKVFDAHPEAPIGVVAFVCSAGFTTGPGFAGMREYLRRSADEGWIIDLTPEGHQPPVRTRFFRGNQQPLCVAVFVRTSRTGPRVPATVHFASVSGDTHAKASELETLSLDGPRWTTCSPGWGDPFRPGATGFWASMPTVDDVFPWTAPGVKPNRTWVYSPSKDVLRRRWRTLMSAEHNERRRLLKETSATHLDSRPRQVTGMIEHSRPLAEETGECPSPRRIGFRSFDRQWTIPDARVHHRPSPPLWWTNSSRQIFVVEQHSYPISDGPGLVFSALIPDMHYFMGHHGGRVLPLYRDASARTPNVAPGLSEVMAGYLGSPVSPEDIIAYVAAVSAHRGYTARLIDSGVLPGVRVPLTTDACSWWEAVELGRLVICAHTFGERFGDAADGYLQSSSRSRALVTRTIPDGVHDMPETISFDAERGALRVGSGEIAPVGNDVWEYEVSGMKVVKHWFGYRKKNPAGNGGSELNLVSATYWDSTTTTELLELVDVLGRCLDLEPQQDDLLARIVSGPLVSIDELTARGILPVSASARRPPRDADEPDLFG